MNMSFQMKTLACGIALAVPLFGCLLPALAAGCGKSDDTATGAGVPDAAPARTAGKGEVCRTTVDCTAPLVCVPSVGSPGGVCEPGAFNITPTAKQCVTIQCEQPTDCCSQQVNSQCPTWEQQCLANPTGLDGARNPYCDAFDRYCKCDAAKWNCIGGACSPHCTGDPDCAGAHCGADGRCVQCVQDAQCGAGRTCVEGACKSPCTTDSECAGFERCAAGTCVPSGCKTDRECVNATRNVQATCGADGKCAVACASDIECSNPLGYTFYSCIAGRCIYVGCESDKDCQLYSNGGADVAPSGRQHVVCR